MTPDPQVTEAEAYTEGWRAFRDPGTRLGRSPFPRGSAASVAWHCGFLDSAGSGAGDLPEPAAAGFSG